MATGHDENVLDLISDTIALCHTAA